MAPKKQQTDERQRLNLTLTDEERDALERWAAEDMRTLTGLVKVILTKALMEKYPKGLR